MKKLALLLLVLCTTEIFAQETDTTTVNNLDVVILNGVRAPKLTPITEKTLTREEIQRNYRGEEVPEILSRATPSVISNYDGGIPYGYSYFRMRGIDQARINMTLNGVPLNEPEDQGVYFSNYPNFMDNVQSVQIQRGVGTSSNGVASYGGSINFTTPNGWEKESNIEINYGSYNTKRISGTYSSGLSDNNLSLHANASTFSTDGYRYESGSKGYSGFVSGGYFGEKDIIKFTGFVGNSKNQMAWFAVSEDDIAIDPRTNYNIGDADDEFSQAMAQLSYIRKFTPYQTLNTTLYYNFLEGQYDYFGGNTEKPLELSSDFMGIITNYNYKKGDVDFNGGASANTYEREHTLGDYHTNTGHKDEVSFYSKLNYTIGKLLLYGDVQYRIVKFDYEGTIPMATQEWNFLNPRVGTTLKLSDNFNLYGFVGKSHREPNRTDLFGGNDNLITLNDIEAEEVVDYEAGFNFNNKRFDIQANVYYMDFTNQLSLTGELGPNSLPLVGSFDESYRKGIEVDLSYRITNRFTVFYNESRSKNEITYDEVVFEPLYTPNVIRNVRLGYNDGKFNASVGAKYHSESYIDLANENTTPSFTIFNTNAGYQLGNVYLGVDAVNLTSEEYFTNGYSFDGVNYYYANAPLSVFGTLRYDF